MKISYQWLKKYLPDLQASPEELCQTLPMLGLEVENMEYKGLKPLSHVITGKILERQAHPNADRLGICRVSVGSNVPELSIVCGAQNYKEGDCAPVALPGAILPGDFKIKKSKIRGIDSDGMLCSSQELGLGFDSQGLLILDPNTVVGKPINEVLSDSNVILDISITANRGDALSHWGVAKDLAAYYNIKLQYPHIHTSHHFESNSSNRLLESIHLETELCPLYTAWCIQNVKVQESPDWLKKDLEALGIKPINNIVDITNWVMLETGQPLHAFDATKIESKILTVTLSGANDHTKTLSGQECKLPPGIVIIKDNQKIVALGGLIGSACSQIETSTHDIILESAYFDPKTIRNASKQLNIQTDSAYRFIRDVDPKNVYVAGRRAIDLILEIAGGELLPPPFCKGQAPRQDNIIHINHNYVLQKIGFDLAADTISAIWSRLGFEVIENSSGWQVHVPSLHADICRPIDLVEEFLRIYGTHKIPKDRVSIKSVPGKDDALYQMQNRMAAYLHAQHFTECYNYSIVDAKSLREWDIQQNLNALALNNPLTAEQTHIRNSLIPGLLKTLQHNLHQGNNPEKLFESGRVFRCDKESTYECFSIGFVWTKNQLRQWTPQVSPNFYDAKNILEGLLSLLNIDNKNYTYQPMDLYAYQKEHSSSIGNLFKDQFEGHVGVVNLELSQAYDVKQIVLAAELVFLPKLLDKKNRPLSFKPFSTYPTSKKDICIILDKTIPCHIVQNDLEQIGRKVCEGFFLKNVRIFDIFEGPGLPSGKKSLAFELEFSADSQTLTDVHVNNAFNSIQDHIDSIDKYQVRR